MDETLKAEVVRELENPKSGLPKRGVFPTLVDLLAILGLFFLAQLTTRFIFAVCGWEVPISVDMTGFSHEERRAVEYSLGYGLFLWSIISQPLMLVLVLIYRQLRGGKLWGRVRASIHGFNPMILLWGVVMLFSLVVVVEPAMELLPQSKSPEGRGVYMFCALLFVAPLFEELLCRGVILEAIRAKWGVWAACILSSLIFGLMHVEPQFVLNAFVIGLLLSYVYVRSRSIIAPIILHSTNNLFAYMLLVLGLGDSSLHTLVGDGATYDIIYAVAVVVLILSIVAITRYINRIERAERIERSEVRGDEVK